LPARQQPDVLDIETPVTHPDYSIESLGIGYPNASYWEEGDGNRVLKKMLDRSLDRFQHLNPWNYYRFRDYHGW
jgi:hypothetical protein